MKLTVIIITKNEEENIKDCIKSALWADEVLVVDTGSADKTVARAKKFGARVIEYAKGNFSDWRNKGLLEAKGEWILYLDSDERITDELQKEVQTLINNYPDPLPAYAIPRKNFIFKKEFKYGGQWPDYQKRLFLKKALDKWVGDLHENPKIKKDYEQLIGKLKHPFIHLKHDNLHDMVVKTNKWSEVEAKLMFDAGHPPMNVRRFMTAMIREFRLRMIRQMAFLDGTKGIIYAMYQVFSRFASYAKLWEMQMKAGKVK